MFALLIVSVTILFLMAFGKELIKIFKTTLLVILGIVLAVIWWLIANSKKN